MDRHHVSRIQPEKDEFAPSTERGNLLTINSFTENVWLRCCNAPIVRSDMRTCDGTSRQVWFQCSSDGFDLGKLRHFPLQLC